MALPTAEQVTNHYLYGQDAAPVDKSLASSVDESERLPINVNVQEYMADGPGRFVSATSFSFLHVFFGSIYLEPGTYTKQQIFYALGVEGLDNTVIFNNVLYGTDDADYAERTYIWGTVGFAIGNEALFVVEADGSRHIEQFSIVPLQNIKSDAKENFDFTGGNLSNFANNILGLYDTVDPCRIGKTVFFTFVGDPDTSTMTRSQFNALADLPTGLGIGDPDKIWALTDRLFAAGSTRFLYEGKPVLYGKETADTLSGDLANEDAIDFHMADHRQLGRYVQNGMTYVARGGDDQIVATVNDDILFAGNGNDTLDGGAGSDRLYGNAGADTYLFFTQEGFGHDQINDADGGSLRVNGQVFSGELRSVSKSGNVFRFMNAKGELSEGKERWEMMLDGHQAVLIYSGANGLYSSIVIHGFDKATNNFGLTVKEDYSPPAPAQVDVYDVAAGAYGHEPWAFPNRRVNDVSNANFGTFNREEAAEGWENRSLVYHAKAYEFSQDAQPGQGELDALRRSYLFSGSRKADVLHGFNWLPVQLGKTNSGTSTPYSFSGEAADVGRWIGDILQGLDGDDVISGDGILAGEAGYETGDNDFLVGGRGNDRIDAGGGDDVLFAWYEWRFTGLGAWRYLDAGDFVWDFEGQKIQDPVYGLRTRTISEALRDGLTTAENPKEKNSLNGGAGNDCLFGASGEDVLVGETGDDVIFAGVGKDILLGGDGNDTLLGDSIVEKILEGFTVFIPNFISPAFASGPGLDAVNTSDDIDYVWYHPERFDNTLDYNDRIDGGNGNDTVWGEIGTDMINGGAGNDVLYGDRSNSAPNASQQFVVEVFRPLAAMYHGHDVVDGGAGADTIIGGAGNDLLLGGEGTDRIYADIGRDDTSAVNVVTISAWWGADDIDAGSGDDYVEGEGGNDRIHGGDGNDRLAGDWVTSWSNTANACMGSDMLWGDAGDDDMTGGGRDDVLYGGIGDDVLRGDYGSAGGMQTGNDVLYGEEGNDSLSGDAGNDTLEGGSGNDQLMGGDGDDTFVFAAGDGIDTLQDHSGDSTLLLSEKPLGIKLLSGHSGAGSATLLMADGLSRIVMDDATFSHVKSVYANGARVSLDILLADSSDGGDGYLYGTAGDDNYIVRDSYVADYALWDTGGSNTVRLGDSWASNESWALADHLFSSQYVDVSLSTQSHYVIRKSDSSESYLTIGNAAWNFIEGMSTETLSSINLHITGDSFDNVASGKHGDDWLEAGGGADELYGGNGADMLDGGTDSDSLYGESGDDLLSGAEGHDVLFGGAGDDWLYGGDGQDELNGEDDDDHLYGGAHDDSLYGGLGDDVMDGGAGRDVLVGGDGDDQLYAGDKNSSYSSPDTLFGGNGSDVFHLRREGAVAVILDTVFDHDRIVLDVSSSDIHLDNAGLTILDTSHPAQTVSGLNFSTNLQIFAWQDWQTLQLQFVDGEVWDGSRIQDVIFAGSDHDDWIIGDETSDVLCGQSGADTLYGQAGDDSLDGGAGNDTLCGGSGMDVYRFGVGYGNDTIIEVDWRSASVICLDASIQETDTRLFLIDNQDAKTVDLLIRNIATSESLTLQGFFDDSESEGDRSRALSLSFSASGNSWDMARIEQALFAHAANISSAANSRLGTSGNDHALLTGNDSRNYIFGDAGHDTLNGKGGNDWLDGGAGNDSLTGGTGNDVFRFGNGSGNDLVTDASTNDTLRLDYNTAIHDLVIDVIDNNRYRIARQDDSGNLTDTVVVNQTIGHLVDGRQETLTVADQATLLSLVSRLKEQMVVVSADEPENGYVLVKAADLLGNNIDDAEKSRWQLIAAEETSSVNGLAGFSPFALDTDSDGTEDLSGTFVLIENFLHSGSHVAGFLPPAGTGSASFRYTLQRDDGLTLIREMNVRTQVPSSQSGLFMEGSIGDDLMDASFALTGATSRGVTFHGGAGDDSYYGSQGNDTVHYSLGDGHDVLHLSEQIGNGRLERMDVLQLGEGIVAADVTLRRIGDSLQIGFIDNTADSILVEFFFHSPGSYFFFDGWLNEIRFDDGSYWNLESVLTNPQLLQASENDDVLAYGAGDDSVEALSGHDTVFGMWGNDVLVGGSGNDTLLGGVGNDRLYGGNVDNASGDAIGSSGYDMDSGNDRLAGEWGDDFLWGGLGVDTFVVVAGQGYDVIDNSQDAEQDNILQVSGVSDFRSLWFGHTAGNALDIRFIGQTGGVCIQGTSGASVGFGRIQVTEDDGDIYQASLDKSLTQLITAMATFNTPGTLGEISQTLSGAYESAWTLTAPAVG